MAKRNSMSFSCENVIFLFVSCGNVVIFIYKKFVEALLVCMPLIDVESIK